MENSVPDSSLSLVTNIYISIKQKVVTSSIFGYDRNKSRFYIHEQIN